MGWVFGEDRSTNRLLRKILSPLRGLASSKETPSPTPRNTSFSLLSSPSFFLSPPEVLAFVFLFLRCFVSRRFDHSSRLFKCFCFCVDTIFIVRLSFRGTFHLFKQLEGGADFSTFRGNIFADIPSGLSYFSLYQSRDLCFSCFQHIFSSLRRYEVGDKSNRDLYVSIRLDTMVHARRVSYSQKRDRKIIYP